MRFRFGADATGGEVVRRWATDRGRTVRIGTWATLRNVLLCNEKCGFDLHKHHKHLVLVRG